MFKKLLVPVDLTEKNRRSLEVARKMAMEDEAEIVLLHVIEELLLPLEEVEDFYDELQDKAVEAMSKMAAPLEKKGIGVREVVTYGPRAERVVEFAAEDGVDLIILNSHRVDPESPGLGWATLSYKVAILSQCPVLLVK